MERARRRPMRLIYAEGEDERMLRAAQIVLDDKLALPTLIGRRAVVETRIEKLGLRLKIGDNVELIDPEKDERYHEYWPGRSEERRGGKACVSKCRSRWPPCQSQKKRTNTPPPTDYS